MDIEERITGCIIGLAFGDAFGAPLDGAKPGAIKSAFRELKEYAETEDIPGGNLNRRRTPGLYGAPTQQAIVFMETMLEKRGLDCTAASALLAQLSRGDSQFQYGVLRGASPELCEAVDKLKSGYNRNSSGVEFPGSTPATRVAPVAIYHNEHKHFLTDKIIESCIITHKSPMSISATVAVAHLIGEILAGSAPTNDNLRDMVSALAAACRAAEEKTAQRFSFIFNGLPQDNQTLHVFSGAMELLAQIISEPQETIDERIAQYANPHAPFELKRPTLDFAPASVPRAISIFLKNAADPMKALVAAVYQGGATEAAGAIVGALCGALHGETGLPQNLVEKLANRKQLKDRAQMLASGKLARGRLTDLYEMEYSLTRKEHEERAARIRKSGRDTRPAKPAQKQSQNTSAPDEKFDRKKYEKILRKEKHAAREKFFQD